MWKLVVILVVVRLYARINIFVLSKSSKFPMSSISAPSSSSLTITLFSEGL